MRSALVGLFLAVSLQAAPYFALSRVAGDGLNPGYPVFRSAVYGFGRNPAAGDGWGLDVAGSVGGLAAEAESYEATLLFGGAKGLRWGLQAVAWRHEAFTVWELDRYYDPREAGRIEPGGFVLGFGWPVLVRWGEVGHMGMRVKVLHEDDGVVGRSALAVDAGAVVRTPWLDAGLALSDVGVPFFRTAAGWLPTGLNLGLMREFVWGGSRPGLALSLEVYDAALRVRAGGWWTYVLSSIWALGVQVDVESGWPGSLMDGVSPAVYAEVGRGGWRVKVWYRMRLVSDLLHAVGVGFGF